MTTDGRTTDGLRLAMVWVPDVDDRALELALDWGTRLGAMPDGLPRVCVWTTSGAQHAVADRHARLLCWHDLHLPPSIDRHVNVPTSRTAWSPWGTKSGPNFQFFEILRRAADRHREPWLLLIEPDTIPLGDDVRGQVAATLDRHPDAWVIGGRPHPSVRPALAPDLWHHLNGAALYRVGCPDFAEFRDTIWIPSLLWMIRRIPTFAFDCVTDPEIQAVLPDRLRAAWAQVQDRLVPTWGIVNASTRRISAASIEALLGDPEVAAGLAQEGVTPWLLHAKGLA